MLSAVKTLLLVFASSLFAQFQTGAASVTFSNAAPIIINDYVTSLAKASPYPSLINVSGVSGQAVTKVTVSLYGLTHAFPSDINILLTAPNGASCVLMSLVGGQSGPNVAVTNLLLTLDDNAANSLPVNSRLNSGTFKPTNGYLDPSVAHTNLPYDLPPSAPAGNSNAPASLSTFKNIDPTGAWSLFVVDAASEAAGIISNGWSLALTTSPPLSIARVSTNILLSWPASATNCHLQTSASATYPTGWSNVLIAPHVVGQSTVVTNPLLPEPRFFKLISN